MPEFTLREVDLCLDQAACLRRSYGYYSPDGALQFSEEAAEAAEWDALARKLAGVSGAELERECGACTGGVTSFGRPCMECVGTALLPPAQGGNEPQPFLEHEDPGDEVSR